MLSRVAQNLYWLGRYLERADNTARVVRVNANLLLDLPRCIAPGWQPLIEITGSDRLFRERYPDYEERHVVRFLLADPAHSGSILSSLRWARENARTIRDIVPREAWEQINELHLFAEENLQLGLSKRGRYAYLKHLLRSTHALTGTLASTMSHDAGFDFLRIGRRIERGDMTTRIIDVRSASLLPTETSGLRPFENIQWMSVLKSLSAYQMYRRQMQLNVRREEVLRFLFQDDRFPRAVYSCLSAAAASLARLPHQSGPARALDGLQQRVRTTDVASLSQSALHDFIDRLQVGLGEVHAEISHAFFLPDASRKASATG